MAPVCPQVVLLDLMVPGVSGLDALTYFRQHQRRVPVIVVTSMIGQEMVPPERHQRAAGAQALDDQPLPREALQDAALGAWHGQNANLKAGQEALYHWARCNGAASLGKYTDEMETALAGPALRHITPSGTTTETHVLTRDRPTATWSRGDDHGERAVG
jgi:CheY-like chemotaxis protein